MAERRRAVYALIGPKGAGKTYLGRLAERELGIVFVDVEAIALGLRAAGENGTAAVYREVERQVVRRMETCGEASIDLTGAAPETAALLANLEKRWAVRRVRVDAPLALCLERTAVRGGAGHLPADRAMIRKVHEISSALAIDYDLWIDNSDADDAELLAALRSIRP